MKKSKRGQKEVRSSSAAQPAGHSARARLSCLTQLWRFLRRPLSFPHTMSVLSMYSADAAAGVAPERAPAPCAPQFARFLTTGGGVGARSRAFANQYSHMYTRRLAQMRGLVRAAARARWPDAGALCRQLLAPADTRALCARAPPFSLSLGLWHCRLLARGGQGH